MNHNFEMEYKDICVKPLKQDELEKLRLMRNRHRECFFSDSLITEEQQINWYEKYLTTPNDYVFSVFCGDIWIGSTSLYNVSKDSAEFGRIVIEGERAGKKGLGSMTVKAVCLIGFEFLNLKSVYLEVFSDNVRAVNAYKRAGFTEFSRKFLNGKSVSVMKYVKE